jgi:sortase A
MPGAEATPGIRFHVMRTHWLRWTERGLYVCGAALLALWLAWTLDAAVFQSRLSRRLDDLWPRSSAGLLAHEADATRAEARSSGLVGRIEIPRLRLSAMIVEGTTGRALRRGVGHIEPTAFPGERGNVGLAGHRDTFFRKLRHVAKGDSIRIATPDGTFAYRVESLLIVDPDRSDLLNATPAPVLTLVTCYPFDWIGPAPRRFVVRARPLS